MRIFLVVLGWLCLSFPCLAQAVELRSRVAAQQPFPVSNPAVVESHGLLYVLGGNSQHGPSARAFTLDPDRRQWRELAPMPEARSLHGAVLVGKKILVLGGSAGKDPARTVLAFDPESGNWSTHSTMPFALERFGIATLGGRVYLLGGSAGGKKSRAVHRFDPTTGRWDVGPQLPEAVDRLAAATLQGRLYVVGGEDSQGRALAKTWCLQGDQWLPLAPLHTARKNFAMCRWGNGLVVAGGWGGGWGTAPGRTVFYNSVETYRPQQDRWETTEAVTPSPRECENPFPRGRGTLRECRDACRAAVHDGHVWVLGGYGGKFVSEVEELRWVVPEKTWQWDNALKYHLAWLPAAEETGTSTPLTPLGFTPDSAADIDNIRLDAFRSLGFAVPAQPEEAKWKVNLKFFRYPAGGDPGVSSRRSLGSFLGFDTDSSGQLETALQKSENVLVKRVAIELADRPYGPQHPFPPTRISAQPQSALDEHTPFCSLYLKQEANRPPMAGIQEFRNQLEMLCNSALTPLSGPQPDRFAYFLDDSELESLRGEPEVTVFRLPHQAMDLTNFSQLPMPQDPQHLFLRGLLLVYKDVYRLRAVPETITLDSLEKLAISKHSQILEVGTTLRQ